MKGDSFNKKIEIIFGVEVFFAGLFSVLPLGKFCSDANFAF